MWSVQKPGLSANATGPIYNDRGLLQGDNVEKLCFLNDN